MTEQQNNLPSIPQKWVWTEIGEVCIKPQYGWTTRAVAKGRLHLLRTSDITSGKIDWNSVPFCKEEPPNITKYLLEDGDIVISRAGSVGYSYLIKNPKPAIFASYLIRFKTLIEEHYLAFFLKSLRYWKSISEKKLGIAIPNVNATKLKQISIPLPPFPEQGRIVAKIEELFTKLDAGVESLRKVKVQLQRYRQSVLKHAFEGKLTEKWRNIHKHEIEPAPILLEQIKKEGKGLKGRYKPPPIEPSEMRDIPDTWVWTRIGQISEMFQYGTSEKARKNLSGIPVLRMGNIQDGQLVFDALKYYPPDWASTDNYILEDGDVLFNRTNSPKLVGKTAVYKRNHPRSVFASYLIRIKTHKNAYKPDLLSFYINSFFGRQYIASVVSQQVGQANVNGVKLSSMPIPLIPLVEQEKIVERIGQYYSIAEQIQKSSEMNLIRCERLRQSIFKKAFEGRLVPQDTTDEPAEKLLERIREEKEKHNFKEKRKKRIKSKKEKRLKQVGLSRYVR